MKRRDLLKGGMAMSAFAAATPLLAHDEIIPDYQLPEAFMPHEVRLETVFEPNEIHVDPGQFALYWTLPKKKALRYTAGIGRPGLYEAGEFFVGAKREWPYWRPTPDMIKREPNRYGRLSNGLPGVSTTRWAHGRFICSSRVVATPICGFTGPTNLRRLHAAYLTGVRVW